MAVVTTHGHGRVDGFPLPFRRVTSEAGVGLNIHLWNEWMLDGVLL